MQIYKITNTINNKIYIGKDTRNNPNYMGSGVYLKKAINKYGIENFRKEILENVEDNQTLCQLEKEWIKFYKESGHPMYNISDGGDGGNTWENNPNFEEIKNKYYKPVIIDNVEYQSINKAASSLGIGRKKLKYRICSKNFLNYRYKGQIKKLDPNYDHNESKRKKISINGEEYSSITSACKLLEKPFDYISWRLNSSTYTDWYYIDKEVNLINTGIKKMKKVNILGKEYESISQAVIETGINREIMRYRIKTKKYTEYFYVTN